MKQSKLLKSIFLTLLLSALPFTASAYDFMVNGIAYNKNSDGKTVTVTFTETVPCSYNNYNGLTTANIPSSATYNGKTYSVTSIGQFAFYACNGLTSITIPNSVTSIGESAFSGCSGLTSVTIDNSVTSIGYRAFYCCSNLTSITIPESVTSIENSAFYNCSGLTQLTWNAINCSNNGNMATSHLMNVTIGNSVQTLPAYFVAASKITSITIPNTVTSIGENAFNNCSELRTVNWNAKSCKDFTSTLSSQPFKGLSITTINFGNEVEKIPAYVCYGLSVLIHVTIGNSVTSIGENAFHNCSKLRTVSWNAKSCTDFTSTVSSQPFKGLTSITTIDFGNEVEKIPSYVCYGLSALTNVTIPNSVTIIGNSAFSSCSGLTSVTIGNSVTTIGNSAFSSCSGLTSVTIGNSVTSIGDYAFQYCSGLTSVTIPNSVTSIGESAFSGCRGLTSVTIGNSVTTINSGAFRDCTGLTSIIIPNSVITIGNSAFYNCNGLTQLTWNAINCLNNGNMTTTNIEKVTIGNSVQALPDNFVSSSKITTVTIPNSVSSIGEYAFASCGALKHVICKATTPPIINNSFTSSYPILIPPKTMNAYKNADYWKNYNLRYSLTKVTPCITHAFIVSEDKEISHIVSVRINNNEYIVSNDSIMITGLKPDENYIVIAGCNVAGDESADTITFTTMTVRFESLTGSSTQTTITPKFKVYRDDAGLSIQSSGASYNSKDYIGSIIQETSDYFIIETAPITGLTPNSKIYYTPWVTCNGKRCEGPQYNITTQNIGTSSNVTTGPTNVEMTASYNAGDATVKDAYFTFNGTKMKKLSLTGLKPSTSYSVPFTMVTTGGNVTTNMSFTTKSLTMTTQAARMLTDTSPMLIAETNMADVETSCGFEWRRNDAPEEMPSTKVYCPVYGGTMAGVLKNMSPNVYYKYRPFYKASDGSEYYGKWIAFITADAGVTFEPVVYTYKAPEVTQNTATLQGVALSGSSEITEQGFEYWRMNGSKAPTGTVNKVTATGQRMSATVQGLNAGATYGYRSYVKAGGQTYYGSEEQFTTEKPTGDVNGDGAVNVSDVTTLVNMILGVIPKDNTRADIDGNGTVNVSDVTALVRLILNV